jgi:serine/threonine-protein kinase CTR1
MYAFGVILWELVTLDKPWKTLRSVQELITRVGLAGERLATPNPWPQGCPRQVRDIMEACFGEPAGRPEFLEIVQELEGALREM